MKILLIKIMKCIAIFILLNNLLVKILLPGEVPLKDRQTNNTSIKKETSGKGKNICAAKGSRLNGYTNIYIKEKRRVIREKRDALLLKESKTLIKNRETKQLELSINLSKAIINDYPKCYAYLKSNNIKQTDKGKILTDLELALWFGSENIIKMILEDENRTKSSSIYSKIALAENAEDLNNLDITSKINKKTGPMETSLLFWASNSKIAEYMIQHGSEYKVFNGAGMYVLHTACERGLHGLVKYYIETKKYDIDVSSKRKMTPLMYAAMYGNIPIVEYLIDKGADVNARDETGYTPLHWSLEALELAQNMPNDKYTVATNIIDIVLEKCPMLILQKNIYGRTPYMEARQDSYSCIWSRFSIAEEYYNVFNILLKHSSDVNVKSNKGYTILHSFHSDYIPNIDRYLKNKHDSVLQKK